MKQNTHTMPHKYYFLESNYVLVLDVTGKSVVQCGDVYETEYEIDL